MNIVDFKLKAHKICDRWYFKQTDTDFEMWERPYLRGPGFEKDYRVLVIPLKVLCLGETKDDYLTNKLQGLKWNHAQRMMGKQVEDAKKMEKRNAQRKVIRKKDWSRETRAFYKDTRKVWKKLGEETLGTGLRNKLIAATGKGSWDDCKRAFNKQMEQRQGIA